MTNDRFDYIILGGGLAGCVVAGRLAEKYPDRRVLVIEAGPVPDNDRISAPLDAFALSFSELTWKYITPPQKNVGNKPTIQLAGKALSGGSAINYGGWTRGPTCEYDQWAEIANEPSWNWDGMRKYFIKSETYISGETPFDEEENGSSGPISVVGITASHPERKYPLREKVAALFESLGLAHHRDGNSGSTAGFTEANESWRDGKRQPAAVAYRLAEFSNITIRADTLVHQILFKDGTAVGARTSAGEFYADKEVVLSCGAYRSPHLLMLSGVGPKALLEQHKIPVVHDAPAVGTNLHDHFAVPLCWKLREPGLALGGPALTGPAYAYGLPMDWVAFEHDLAAQAEGADELEVRHLAHPGRCHTELFIMYTVVGPGAMKYRADGTILTTYASGTAPTSRGTVSIAAADPTEMPVVDPNYLATHADRLVQRKAVRKMIGMMTDTPFGRENIERELTEIVGMSDEAIDARIVESGGTSFHPGGTCAMGTVVDGECKVKGVKSLRLIDASVIPLPLGAHYQATVYALAEKAVDLM